MTNSADTFDTDYQRVEAALEYLAVHHKEQPSLNEIAAQVHLSPTHFQKLFKRWAGISPTQFLQYLTIEYAKNELANSATVLDAAMEAGLSGPGRLHDLFVTWEAITPGEYRKLGDGLVVNYGYTETRFGNVFLATTERGICAIRFVTGDENEALATVAAEWPGAAFMHRPDLTTPIADAIFAENPSEHSRPFHLLLKGTNFQVSVWRALLAIPNGRLLTYGHVAEMMGKPSATRAVASAIAKNPVGYLIPCHRVINSIGQTHNYRWGATRKRAIIGWEAGQRAELALAS